MRLLDALRRSESRYTVEDYANWVAQYGYSAYTGPVQLTLKGSPAEGISAEFAGFASAYKSNGIIFACMLARMSVFSATRFQWQRLLNGRPSEMFGTADLATLEIPWAGGTTQDLLMRMIQDADLAGNSYWRKDGTDLVRLRPDWTSIILKARPEGGYRKVGYYYEEPGKAETSQAFMPDQVAHFAPLPDPFFSYRGMSWLTPVIREIQTDNQMSSHKSKFFANAATPNLAVVLHQNVKPEGFARFEEMFQRKYAGPENAGKTLMLGGGADVTVVGKDFRQMDFSEVQGHGETRIAAAAGTPPIIVGLSEGLAAATYSNYGQARRRFADGTIHPLWQNVAGTLQQILPPPAPGTRLWYDSRDVPFLREDEKDAAAIKSTEATTISTLIDGGFEPDSVVKAVTASDYGLLKHSGLVSVQLQVPGADPTSAAPNQEQGAGA